MKKTLLQTALMILIFVAGYLLFLTINTPIVFAKEFASRSNEVVEHLKDIRTIEKAYKIKNGSYTDSFEELINFIKNDSLVYEVASGSEYDSTAVADGLVTSYKIKVSARDTLFGNRVVDFDNLALVPNGEGAKFLLGSKMIITESGVEVNVFEAKVEYKVFLSSIPDSKQEIINIYDKRDVEKRYPGLQVGSLEKANNDAGNWEN